MRHNCLTYKDKGKKPLEPVWNYEYDISADLHRAKEDILNGDCSCPLDGRIKRIELWAYVKDYRHFFKIERFNGIITYIPIKGEV